MTKDYVFMGVKKYTRYYFGTNDFSLVGDRYTKDVRKYPFGSQESVHLYTDYSGDHTYAVGDVIHYNGKDAQVVRIAKHIEGGHFIVYTDYVTETVDDEESKQKAIAEKDAYERLKAEQAQRQIVYTPVDPPCCQPEKRRRRRWFI